MKNKILVCILAVFLFTATGNTQMNGYAKTVDAYMLNKSPVKNSDVQDEMYLMPVQVSGYYAFLDIRTKDTIAGGRYDSVKPFYSYSNGLAPVKKNGKWGMINKYGKELTPCVYDEVDFENDELYKVKKAGRSGYVNRNGKEILPCIYTSLATDAGNKIWVEKDKKWGLYNINGDVISQPRFDGFQTFADGLAWVKNGEKWGFINEAGVMLISATYDWAQPFSDGLAVVSKDGMNGYVDKQGEEVITLHNHSVKAWQLYIH